MKKLFFTFTLIVFAGLSYANNINHLMPEERNIVSIFQKASPRVVYVHRINKIKRFRFRPPEITPSGTGSGIIWDNKGHIVTNYHVIHGADSLSITIIGGITVPVKVISAEPRKDLAVLQILDKKIIESMKLYKDFPLADTQKLLVGQTAIAIGNPYGLDHSLSVGVISALKRQVLGIGGVKIYNMIQTDAAVNPGNSGGPLLDSSGNLIGLNTVIFSNSGSSAGVGFAIPAEEIKKIVNQIIKHGRVELAGIGILPADAKFAHKYGVDGGILISEILPNTPAQFAKLRPTYRDKWGRMHIGDVIIAIKGKPIKDYDSLYNLFSNIKVGDEIGVTVLRDNLHIYQKIKTIDVAANY